MIRTINRIRNAAVARSYDMNVSFLKWLTSPLFQSIVQAQLQRNQFGKDIHLELRRRYEDKLFVDTRIYRDLIRATIKMFQDFGVQEVEAIGSQFDSEQFYKEFQHRL